MNVIARSAALFSLVFAGATFAQTATPVHRMSEHPAVIVKRNAEKQGYDYVSKFYPHPAWLYLQSGPTPDRAEDVAVRKPEAEHTTTASTSVTTGAVAAGSSASVR